MVLLICLALGFGAGAWARHIGSASAARDWFTASGHGSSQSNRLLRLATGLPRACLYIGKDGILYKRFLHKDPFAPVTIANLVTASLWKLVTFDLFLLCLAWELLRPSAVRWPLVMLLTGALPTLFFAVFVFEPGSPERYFPAYPFLILAVSSALRDFPRRRRAPQFLLAAFLICMCVTNVYSMNLLRIGAEDRASLTRILPLKNRLNNASLVAILSNQDDLLDTCNRNPVSAVNRPALLLLYDVVQPANLRILTWREEFAYKALEAWGAGGEVWVSTRLWQPTPRPDWNWVEGDDSRIAWSQIQAFFTPFQTDDQNGGTDGFFRLRRTEAAVRALTAVSSQFRPAR